MGQPTPSVESNSDEMRTSSRPWVKELLDWVKTLAVALAIVLSLHLFVFNLSTVEGHSMEPTLHAKEWLFVNKAVFLFGSPALGDVIIVKDPEIGPSGKDYLVKRIIGVPGDIIEIRNRQLYRNNELIVERYTDNPIDGQDMAAVEVGEGSYFLMGDNRHAHASRDSRSFGTVPRDQIMGRADIILWPITKMTFLK
ncbi:signal peptidase I [Paenibacillaceae bacterium]|nr:signal peptidase I [Paenibacillaceae bacterium]